MKKALTRLQLYIKSTWSYAVLCFVFRRVIDLIVTSETEAVIALLSSACAWMSYRMAIAEGWVSSHQPKQIGASLITDGNILFSQSLHTGLASIIFGVVAAFSIVSLIGKWISMCWLATLMMCMCWFYLIITIYSSTGITGCGFYCILFFFSGWANRRLVCEDYQAAKSESEHMQSPGVVRSIIGHFEHSDQHSRLI